MKTPKKTNDKTKVAVIGAGPAGLMAAEVIAKSGIAVDVFDSKASAARKFLLAGVGGMNITHAEEWPLFMSRYGQHQSALQQSISDFTPNDLRNWIHELGIETFVGTSGRVFPTDMKAAPLLRAWLHRLRELGVQFHMRHHCKGISKTGNILVEHDGIMAEHQYASTVFAMGGASWPQLGSTGEWQNWLTDTGVTVLPLIAANCGFNCEWSTHLKKHFAGSAIKNAELHFYQGNGRHLKKRGEFILSEYGVEGSAIYALSSVIRDHIASHGTATLNIDLCPQRSEQQIAAMFELKDKSLSTGSWLRKKLKLTPAEVALINETGNKAILQSATLLAKTIKNLPITLHSTRPLSESISSAGGIAFSSLNDDLMLKHSNGIFFAGEMLDWEAPTGGYLLTACFATGKRAGMGAVKFIAQKNV